MRFVLCALATTCAVSLPSPLHAEQVYRTRWRIRVTYADKEEKTFVLSPSPQTIAMRSSLWKCRTDGIDRTPADSGKVLSGVTMSCEDGRSLVMTSAACYEWTDKPYTSETTLGVRDPSGFHILTLACSTKAE